ncbi:uncharacterized protein FFB20_08931 [Fusarium fujikuroi]|nr:uncharacterized protein FPRN_00987 [Fusarium proliferatum]SCN91272.1 uncharacterized protein FFB20_08931 [Fusarium fujikuroi]
MAIEELAFPCIAARGGRDATA